jgi:hypothetical protein
MKLHVPAGIAIVAAHLAAFVALADRSAGTELQVYLPYVPLVAPHLSLPGEVPDAIEGRVTSDSDGTGPGLRRKRWRVEYRGGFERVVGATQLVGPFQAPGAPACSGRVVVGQRLLDQIAPVLQRLLDTQLKGEDIFGLGAYQHLEPVVLKWARFDTTLLDGPLVGEGGAPHGYIRVTTTIVFARASVPLVIVLVPEQTDTALHFRATAHADIAFGNRVAQWIGDKLPLDRLATRLANDQISDTVMTTLQPPPPFQIDKRQELRFVFCRDPVEIVDNLWGAVPFAVQIGNVNAVPEILPPHFEHAPPRTPATTTTLAIDLDIDALNAMLFELWRTGWLDTQLDHVGLDRRFNSDPIVTEYLSVRLSPLRLALPPVIEPDGDKLRLAADARVTIGADPNDARDLTVGRVFGALDFRIGDGLAPAVDLGALELVCEHYVAHAAGYPILLVPCYSDLVAALADRGGDFHGALTDAFTTLLADIFVERRFATGLAAELAIHHATPSLAPNARGLHLELDASVIETR